MSTRITLLCSLVLAWGCEDKPRPACANGAEVTIAGNHGHSAELPPKKLPLGVSATAPVTGGSHEHALVLRASEVEALSKGETVTTRTSSVNAHLHEVSVRCK
ncbi:MAG: hypothetical protein R3B13_07115 [Polyangiaceae bacterium]